MERPLFRKTVAAFLSACLALTPGVSSAAQSFSPSGKGKGVEVFASASPSWKGPVSALLLSHGSSLSASLPALDSIDLDDAGAFASLAPVLQHLEASPGLDSFEKLSPAKRAEAFKGAVAASKVRLAKEAEQLKKKASALLFDPTSQAEVVAKLGMLQTTLAPYLEDETLTEVREAYKLGFGRLSEDKKARVQKALDAMAAGLGGGTLVDVLDQGAVSASGPPSKNILARLGRFLKGGSKEQAGPDVPSPKARPAVVRKVQEKWQDFKELLRRTSIEILIGVGIGVVGGIAYSHHHEETRTHVIPLGFSEIHQIERDAAKQGKEVGPTTRYLTSVNDLTMKVFETWNDSWEQTYVGDNTHKFAFLLDMRMDPTMKFHKYEVYDYLRTLPAESQAVLDQLKDFVAVRDGIRPIAGHFDRAWDESHIDTYHTEYYEEEETETDSDGNTHTVMVTKSRQVYDYTTHSYWYYPKEGEQASSGLDKLLKEHPALRFDEVLLSASQTNAEGEYAAQKSRKNEGKKSWTSGDYQQIADRWKQGSTLVQNLPAIYGHWSGLPGDADAWRSAKRTAHGDSYITYSHHDSGPREMSVAENAASRGHALDAKITEVLEGVEFVQKNTPVLEGKIKSSSRSSSSSRRAARTPRSS